MKRLLYRWSGAVLLVAHFGVFGTAQAQQGCNLPRGSFDQVYCQAKVLIRADDELNATYQKLLKRLNAAGQATLRQTQRAWLAGRDTDCVQYDTDKGDLISADCAVDKTTERLNFLNDRLRECLSSGCQISRLR